MRWQLHVSEMWRGWIETGAWVVAAAWCWRTADAVTKLPTVTRLQDVEWDLWAEDGPSLVVVVPAKDEAANIAATMDALLLADYPKLRIVAVDDRSTDGTGEILDSYAARFALRPVVDQTAKPKKRKGKGKALKATVVAAPMVQTTLAETPKGPPKLEVIHVTDLPEGWLGKTFAMTVATANSESEYVLYTDADVLFSPSILRRAVAFADMEQADHLVVLPTMQVKSWGEGIVLGFFQVFGVWASRLWKVEDPRAKRDIVGVGAFNMVRRSALEKIGGWAPQRLAVLEDVTLGRRMKAAGMRQRVAVAPGLVLVHWARGARGLMNVMTKNMFSAFNFQPLLLGLACLWIFGFCLLPIAGLGWWGTLVPALIVLACVGATYRSMEPVSSIPARYAWGYPLGALALVWAMLRSMVVAWVRGGVVWRGTKYELRDLRRHNSPFQWDNAVRREMKAKMRAEP
jgi:cellulose synthase/poly-beta-1,6-N-acetylglucosamine synthase-like glycosyltransferase